MIHLDEKHEFIFAPRESADRHSNSATDVSQQAAFCCEWTLADAKEDGAYQDQAQPRDYINEWDY